MKSPKPFVLRAALALSWLSLGFAPFARAQTPLIRYDFDAGTGANSGSVAGGTLTINALGGSIVSGTISGSGSGNVLNTTGAQGASPGYIYADGTALNTIDAGTTLNAFTATLWVNITATGSAADRLLNFFGASTTGLGGFKLQASTAAATTSLSLFVNDSSVNSSVSTLDITDTWAFIAVSYNGDLATNNVAFYTGTSNSSIASTAFGAVRTLNQGALKTITNNPLNAIRIANGIDAGPANDRSPDGLFDDIRIYNGVLDASQIEAIRLSAIPEPSSGAIFAAIVGLALAGASRRRRR